MDGRELDAAAVFNKLGQALTVEELHVLGDLVDCEELDVLYDGIMGQIAIKRTPRRIEITDKDREIFGEE